MAGARLLMVCFSSLGRRKIFTKSLCQAPIQIQMPALSPTMMEGTITKWLIAEGDSIEIGDAICEVETDKAVVTMESTDEGKLAKILIPEGTSNIKVSVPIAIVAEEGEDLQEAAKMVVQSTAANSEPAAASSQPASDSTAAANTSQPTTTDQRRLISPAVRQTIQHYDVDINKISATGPKGIILKGDVLNYVKTNNIKPKNFLTEVPPVKEKLVKIPPPSTSTKSSQPATVKKGTSFEDVELSNVRKVIAKRLTESKQQIPHSYSSTQCSISKLIKLRKELAQGGLKLSVNDFIIKAVAHTLRQVPEANCVWKEGAAGQSSTVDVSVAVATEGGLITPIIKNAPMKGLQEIGEEIRELAGRAREGRLKPEEFQGGTFTISNLGMFGIREFTAVINPPQTCIMAVGGTRIVPTSNQIDMDDDHDEEDDNNDVETNSSDFESAMTVTLSCDARVVDDVIASKFLEQFRNNIENPLILGFL